MPAFCGVCENQCNNDSGDVRCVGKCKRLFHVECIKEDLEGKKTRSAKDWICKECRKSSSTQSSVNSATSTTMVTKEFLIKIIEDLKKEMFGEIQSFKKEVTDLKTSVEFLSSAVEDVNSTMKNIQADITAMKKENIELRTQNATLKNEVSDLKDRLRSLEQYTRKNNIEISGIPETPRENVANIIKDVGAALGVEVQDNQVAAAHRVPSYKRGRISSLVVQFQSRATRDTWIDNFKKKRTITAKDVNTAYPPNKIYVNEHLSPENKIILAKLKQKSKEIGYKYVWCRDGKFFVRKSDGESCRKISNYEDIDKLK